MRARRLSRLFAVLALAGGFLVATAAPAWAHAVLEESDPSSGAALERAPAEIRLNFSEGVEISLGSIQLLDCSGATIDLGTPQHPNGDDRAVAAGVGDLASGIYVVSWRVISADAHPIHGTFPFRVGAGIAPDLSECSTPANESSATVGFLFGLTRTLVFVGLALLIGGVVFLVIFARGTIAAARTRLLMWIGWAVLVVATIVGVMLQGPYSAGTGLGDAFDGRLLGDVLDTRYGHVAELRLALLAIALVVLVLLGRSDRRAHPSIGVIVVCALVGFALAMTPGLSGHASAGEFRWLAVPMDAVHVAAMSVWFGGLVALVVAALGGGFSGGLRRAVFGFSRLAFWCVMVLIATGAFASWRQVGFSIEGYTDTSFGNILLVKLGLVLMLIALAAVSRAIVRKRRAAPLDAPDSVIAAVDERMVQGLRQSVGGEVLLGLAVLVASAFLVQAPPARDALVPGLYNADIEAGEGNRAMVLQVTIDPARTGINSMHIFAYTPQGAELPVGDMSAEMTPADGGNPITANLVRGGATHFITEELVIPTRGDWQLVIHVRRGEFDDTAATATVPIG